MRKIHILFPTEVEAKYFEPALDGAYGDVRRHVCGVGMAECAAATAHIITALDPDIVILAGIAGTYSDRPAVGETVLVSSETVADLGRSDAAAGRLVPLFQRKYTAEFLPVLPDIPAAVSNTVNCAGGVIAEPNRAEIENMEGAAFFAMCRMFGVAAMEIRTVSNVVGQPVTAETLDSAARKLAEDLKKVIPRL